MPHTKELMKEIETRAKPVTLEQIAQQAGVASRTVSDALKGTGRVAAATRENVLRIAGELNYVPNAAARALATGRTGTIAVLIGPLNEAFYGNMVHQLSSHLTANSYEMLLLPTNRSVRDLVQATQVSAVDGLIIIGMSHLLEEFLQLSGPQIRPYVLVDVANPDNIDHITLDLRPAVEEVLQTMLKAQRQRIAYVANNRDENSHLEVRMETYLNVMEAAHRVPEILSVDTHSASEGQIAMVRRYIETNGCPDALLCQNDETAIYTFRALTELGHRIPDEVLLCGCDGLPYMKFFEPPLSTIELPIEELCATAVRFLQQRLDDPDRAIQGAVMPGQLAARKSLQTPPTGT